MGEHALDWLRENQLPNGSWGSPDILYNHDRVIMLGHGSPNGLLSVGQFPNVGMFIIDKSIVDLLSKKTNNVYIWCNADLFVQSNRLNGFCTGMFISEIEEVWYYNFYDLEDRTIDESNERFASIVSKYINESLDLLFKNVIHDYSLLSQTNLIARFNLERLYHNNLKQYERFYKSGKSLTNPLLKL